MIQKLKLRYKSPDIKTVCIKLLFCFKNVQIIFEKCPGSRIPGSFPLETLVGPSKYDFNLGGRGSFQKLFKMITIV